MACKLSPVIDTPDLQAAQGDQVTLVTKDHIGSVLIAKAEYGGNQLIPAGQAVAQVQFAILPGRNTLKLVFVFTASTAGRGELRESCAADSQFLRDVSGDEPLKIIRILGK